MSDSFPYKEEDNIVYRVPCKNVQCGPVKVDIGANPSTGGGEDASECAPVEELDESIQTKIDIVDAFNLEETSFDKKGFMTYLKSYFKAIRAKIEERNPQEVAAFESNAQTFAKKIFSNFDNYRFYQGQSMDPEAMVCLLETSEDDKMSLIYWKHGLKACKV